MEEHRRCTEWEPGSKSVASGSSAASAITPKSFETNLSILREGLKSLGDATANLGFAIEAAGKGPWEGWPGFTEDEIKKQLEEQQDVVEDLLERG